MLQNRVAIITGGGSGIGKALAQRFAKEGASVVIFDKNGQAAAQTVDELGSGHYYFKVDVSDKKEVNQAVQETINHCGRIDVLVNNAGLFRDSSLITMSEEAWDSVIDVNLKGNFLCIQAVAPIMLKQKYGRIVNVGSVAYKGNYGQANYSSSKAGVIALTKVAAMELAPHITVNCVAPGPTQTPLFASMNVKAMEKLIRKIPLGRVADPLEQANVVLFFASELSSFVTGTVLDVDGGISQGVNLR